jgi:hypothetical protein
MLKEAGQWFFCVLDIVKTLEKLYLFDDFINC